MEYRRVMQQQKATTTQTKLRLSIKHNDVRMCIFLCWTYRQRKKKTKQSDNNRVQRSFSSLCNNKIEEMEFQSRYGGYASIIKFFFSDDAACLLIVWNGLSPLNSAIHMEPSQMLNQIQIWIISGIAHFVCRDIIMLFVLLTWGKVDVISKNSAMFTLTLAQQWNQPKTLPITNFLLRSVQFRSVPCVIITFVFSSNSKMILLCVSFVILSVLLFFLFC